MKYKLPLLLVLSLMWQAAASADEWANIATAVTVTEGRFCVGEAALDGTGTDIKCDESYPYIDDDGNIGIGTASPANSLTVVGDISATTINATQLCDENGANCTTLSGGISGVSALASLTDVSATGAVAGSILRYDGTSWTAVADLMTAISTTSIVSGWPDAITCTLTDPIWGTMIFYGHHMPYVVDGNYYYRANTDTATFYSIIFDSAKSSIGYQNIVSTSDCLGKSIATLYADGQAFNFLGNNGAQTSMTEIADVSASAPTEGQLLSYDASENEWVATDVISKTIIYNSIDDDPCVVTGGVHKLSFNPTTGRLRVCRP